MKLSSTRAALRETQAEHQTSSEGGSTKSTSLSASTTTAAVMADQADRFDAVDALRTTAARVTGDVALRTSTKVESSRPSDINPRGEAAFRIGALAGRDAVSPGRNGLLLNPAEEGVEGVGMVTGGAASVGSSLVTAAGYNALPIGAVAGGAAGVVTVAATAALGGGMAIGMGVNKLWDAFFDKPLGVSIYDWTHPEDSEPAQAPESSTSSSNGTESTSGAASGSTSGATEGEASDADEGSDDDGDDAAGSTGGSDGAGAADSAETCNAESDNDGDGKPDDDGTTPIHDEAGTYVPLAIVSGGRLGRAQVRRDEDAIDVALGAAVSNPIEDDEGSGGGVSGAVTGGGHDVPERAAPAELNAQILRGVEHEVSGGGTINPVTIAALVGIRG